MVGGWSVGQSVNAGDDDDDRKVRSNAEIWRPLALRMRNHTVEKLTVPFRFVFRRDPNYGYLKILFLFFNRGSKG